MTANWSGSRLLLALLGQASSPDQCVEQIIHESRRAISVHDEAASWPLPITRFIVAGWRLAMQSARDSWIIALVTFVLLVLPTFAIATTNDIATENGLPGNPPAEWDVRRCAILS